MSAAGQWRVALMALLIVAIDLLYTWRRQGRFPTAALGRALTGWSA